MAIFLIANLLTLSAAYEKGSKPGFEETRAPSSSLSDEDIRALPTALWAVRLAPDIDPDTLAAELGAEHLGQIGSLEGHHLFRFANKERNSISVYDSLEEKPGVLWSEQQIERPRFFRAPSDPLLRDQWHLKNTGQSGGKAGEDVNITDAWDDGYEGTDVVIAIVDDGLETTHPDIAPNYNAEGSLNPDPSSSIDLHGTAVAGIAAATEEGRKCGVGAAFSAQVSGITFDYFDASEATALSHALQVNDIYNNSWGPADTGTVIDGPGFLTRAAIREGITDGRGGLGAIYVWAAGNGRFNDDDVNADGYANLPYTIAVGATNHKGEVSWYSEPGSAMLINTPSAGDGVGTTTTDRTGSDGYNGLSDLDCTNDFGGTSSASPLAAGIIALMLEANPDLTWRDVQHILVETAERNDPQHKDWHRNGAGHWVNHNYGFGRIDAHKATSLATTWTNVPTATTSASSIRLINQAIPDGRKGGGKGKPITDSITIKEDLTIEHVEVVFDADHSWRGDLRIELTSPDGTTSVMMHQRPNDRNDDFENWRMMSTHHWGEESAGAWELSVTDWYGKDTGIWSSWQLIIHGTKDTSQELPSAVEPLAPSGTISEGNPTYVWNAVSNSTWYYLWVNNAVGTPVIQQWYTAAEAGCSSGAGTCAVTPDFTLEPDNYTWWIQTWNDTGYGPWSSDMVFTVGETPPAATLLTPDGTISDANLTYTWNDVSNSIWYYLWVNDAVGTPMIQQWYTAAEAGCSSDTGTCSVTPDFTLLPDNYTWWIRTWNNIGHGPWSSGTVFTVSSPGGPLPAATLLAPNGTISDTNPTYTWNAVSNSAWYYLWVNNATGPLIQQWYTAADAGCGNGTGTCAVTPDVTLTLDNHTWWIQTWNDTGYGPWSSGMLFTVSAGGGTP